VVYGNGTITQGRTFEYDPAYTYIYTVTPAEGYHIDTLRVNGTVITVANPYVAYNDSISKPILRDYEIEAYFKINTYTVTATVTGKGGIITPSGVTTYDWGSTPSYTITADTGYHISSLMVDDTVEISAANGQTEYIHIFTSITQNHTITAIFAKNFYTVTATAGMGGTITPSGTHEYQTSPVYTIIANEGYTIDSVTIDDTLVTIPAESTTWSHTFDNIEANHTITATFDIKKYTITVTSGTGGKITPDTKTVNHGDSETFTITPDDSYEIAEVLIDGLPAGILTSYTFDSITENHSIAAEFRPIGIISCTIPNFLYATDITTTSAKLIWENTGAFSYELCWRVYTADSSNFNTISGLTVPASDTVGVYDLGGLTPLTYYAWKIKAICNDIETSYSPIATFSTLEEIGVKDITKTLIHVYSYRNSVYVVNESGLNINKIAIFDIYGRQVYQGYANSNREEITLQVAGGTYLVKLMTTAGMSVYKVNILR